MDAMTLLTHRHSAARLTEPAPTGDILERIFAAAARAPDHARLRPWRFLTISGGDRERLGELLEQGLRLRMPEATEESFTKARNAPLRAPLIVAVVCCLREHPKVPPIEQWLSAACAAHAILLAAQAEQFGGVWRTGDYAYDPTVMQGLGLAANERLAGFIYLGTPMAPAKALPDPDLPSLVAPWPGALAPAGLAAQKS